MFTIVIINNHFVAFIGYYGSLAEGWGIVSFPGVRVLVSLAGWVLRGHSAWLPLRGDTAEGPCPCPCLLI